ncbi:MAG: putative aminohydrolase SsnA [Acidobacteriia bacterium]|nr:putative aminohydrolase SsnA [Terriglobia bacterium]
MIVTNARVLTFDAGNRVLDSGEVEILPGGVFGDVRETAGGKPSGEVVDAHGRLMMPALINCHTHLYSAFARGMPPVDPSPGNFKAILRKVWWKLDRTLNREDIYYSALVALIDSARNGVGMLADHHSSPNACKGSLDIVERAFREVGLRGALCYETSHRDGPEKAAEGYVENLRFIQRVRAQSDGTIGASFGVHAAFTVTDDVIRSCVEEAQAQEAGIHIHVAEDRCDAGAVTRLAKFGALNERTVAAHCVHVTAAEMNLLARHGVNVVHNPQSNCHNAVGAARLADLARRKVLVGLGSDGYTPRMWEELKAAVNVQRLASGSPRAGWAEAYAALLNNRVIARKAWGMEIGRIERGAAADFILVDYYPPTPLTAENIMGHLLFGIANAPIDTLVVNGRYVVRGKRCVTVDQRKIAEKAAAQARALWSRL